MTAAWNLLVYAVAHKADELQRITDAIDQMHGALASEQCNIAVQLHAPKHTTRYWLAAGRPMRTERMADLVDASRKATLTDFLDDVDRALPATSTALVLWAHGAALDDVHDLPEGPGGGLSFSRRNAALIAHSATLGYDVLRVGGDLSKLPSIFDLPPSRGPERYGCKWGPDPNSGEFLTNVSMKQAIAASRRKRLDVLALNACWMGAIEVLYELRDVAAVHLACQVYATAWPYGEIIARMSKTPEHTAEQLARQIVDVIRDNIRDKQRDDTLAAIRAGAELEKLARELDKLVLHALQLIESDWPYVHDLVMQRVQRLDDPYQADLMSVVLELAKKDDALAAIAKPVIEQLNRVVIDHTADSPAHPHLRGMSIFCPKDTHIDLIDAYQGTDFRTHSWAKFLVKFQQRSGAS